MQSVRRQCPHDSPQKETNVPPKHYLLILQELSNEEKACEYIKSSDIIDQEHIEENYLSNCENDISDLQDIQDLSGDDSDANESNYFMKTIHKTKGLKGKKNPGSFGDSQVKKRKEKLR
ncbi:hypothetical protein AVEN_197244-1 [Araneus ventricosus]|uniref:Uncharacterized protein n=1 Tax=Araneus ventricosus TaxID=182803 RepID=A0A4Y2JLD1_ARAVE|nr:hypothetical protein AVEN_197244-1 [Araneus ventricosus]